MNSHYFYELKKEQTNYDNIIKKNSSNTYLKDKENLSDQLVNQIKKEGNIQNNNQINENMNTESLIKNNINYNDIETNKTKNSQNIQINNIALTKSDLKNSLNSNNIIINNNNNNKLNINDNINIGYSSNSIEKLQELIESKKIINTLYSIKTSTSVNMNYEEIKFLPNLFLDLQEALKKSNQNVLELKEAIKEKINSEKNLKQKLNQMEKENKDLKEKINLYKAKETELINDNLNLKQKTNSNLDMQNKLEEAMLEIKKMRKLNEELVLKIKKYKNNYGILQTEINTINEKNGKNSFSYMNTIKEMKTELKNYLTEKMGLLQEINNFENIISRLKEENSTLKEKLEQSEKTKEQFEHLFNEYKKINEEELSNIKSNSNIFNENSYIGKDNNKDILATINDNYDKKEFDLKSEVNIWKNNFLNITKFKLYNFEPKFLKSIENLLNIDEKYIMNAPPEKIEISEKVLNYCKNLIEEINYNTINMKELKESLTKEQENNLKLLELLEKEKYLRRKINNRYMYLRGNMRVMCRLRPFLPNEIKNKKSQMETIVIQNNSIIINEDNKVPKNFEFDYLFNQQSTQEDVYEEVNILIQSMIQGNNICIMSYGQTCTGKTYTIQGEQNKEGIASRAARELFEIIDHLLGKSNAKHKNSKKNILIDSSNKYFTKARFTLTIIEIYNEQIFNLLEESTPNLSIYEDSNGNLNIPELSPVNINNFEEACKLFKLSEKFRRTASTEFNERSSRSHCIFSFHIKLIDNENNITRSTLHIIDLAGSERISKAQNSNEKLKKEAISINLSLHSLSNVLSSIANKSNHIPYRDSKLTHYLKESLSENYNILLLLHISPNVKDLSETISTLQFGERIIKLCHHKIGKEKMNLINNSKKNLNEEKKQD